MKGKKDSLKPIFEALNDQDEVISLAREARALERFLRERKFQPVDGEERELLFFDDSEPEPDNKRKQ